jgi:hypothetical protein
MYHIYYNYIILYYIILYYIILYHYSEGVAMEYMGIHNVFHFPLFRHVFRKKFSSLREFRM